MSALDDLIARDPLLAAEVATLTAEQRRWLGDDLELRERAAQLASELGLDESEIYHQLKHLVVPPSNDFVWDSPMADADPDLLSSAERDA